MFVRLLKDFVCTHAFGGHGEGILVFCVVVFGLETAKYYRAKEYRNHEMILQEGIDSDRSSPMNVVCSGGGAIFLVVQIDVEPQYETKRVSFPCQKLTWIPVLSCRLRKRILWQTNCRKTLVFDRKVCTSVQGSLVVGININNIDSQRGQSNKESTNGLLFHSYSAGI